MNALRLLGYVSVLCSGSLTGTAAECEITCVQDGLRCLGEYPEAVPEHSR